jgi:hypothetical protein
MKNPIKFFIAVTFLVSTAWSAIAQNIGNDKIVGKAEVIQTIIVAKQVDLNFGFVAQGSNKTIGLTNNVSGIPNHGTQTTGRFLVSAAAATNVDLTFTTPSNLTSGSNNLPIEDYTYGWHTANTFAGGTTFTGGTTDITVPTNFVESANSFYVFIGATVKPQVSQTIGTYEADITLTATYN